MYGYLVVQGSRPRFFQEEVLGLPLLRGQLPERGKRQRWERRGLDFLRRAGVRTLLVGPESGHSFRLVETGQLYRRKAAQLALLELERREIPFREAVVGLRANRYSRAMEEACRLLAGRVRALALELPQSEDVVWQLQCEYGIPVFRGEGDVTLCFTPAEPGESRLLLGEERPEVEGISFTAPGLTLPEGCPKTPLLALLCETGRLGWEQVEVADAACINHK